MPNLPDNYPYDKQLPVQEVASFDQNLNNYVPDEEQLRRVSSLLDITKQCEDAGIIVTVFGGYGLDGTYGQLTRGHDDVDMLVLDSQIDDTKKVLETLGYKSNLDEIDKYVYKNVMIDPTFKVEFVSISALERFTEKNADYFIPSKPNASLNGQLFRAMTLRGQKDIIEIQNIRAKQKEWKDYPTSKRQNQSTIISELERRNIV